MDILTEILKRISEFYITIGPYRIYAPLFLLILAVIIVISIILGLIMKVVSSHKTKVKASFYDNFCRITQWQRQNIPAILNKYNATKENKYILKYMNNNTVWYTDEILDVDSDIIIRMDSILFEELQANPDPTDNDKNLYSFLLLSTIDRMNGGPNFDENGYEPWISADIIPDVSISDALKHIFGIVLRNTLEKGILDEDLVQQAANELATNPMYQYTNNTYAVLFVSFIHFLHDHYIGKDLTDAGLSYIRGLASICARTDYMAAINKYGG